MGVPPERFRDGDVFVDYPFEDVMFRYDHRTRRFFRKFYGESEEHEVSHSNRLLNDAQRFGDETDAEHYDIGKPP